MFFPLRLAQPSLGSVGNEPATCSTKQQGNLGCVLAGSLSRYSMRRRADLRHLHQLCIIVHMRTTLNLHQELVEKARALTGMREKTALIHAGLEALISRESARRLAALGGSEPALRPIRRRRPNRSQ